MPLFHSPNENHFVVTNEAEDVSPPTSGKQTIAIRQRFGVSQSQNGNTAQMPGRLHEEAVLFPENPSYAYMIDRTGSGKR
jgi:hypothetical protein